MRVLLVIFAALSMSSGTEKKNKTKNFDAIEEIMKLYGKMMALEEKIRQEREIIHDQSDVIKELKNDMDVERKADQKLKTEIEGLKNDIDVERKADQKLKTEIEGLKIDMDVERKADQKLKTELEGLKNDNDEERKADQKLKTEIEGLKIDMDVERKADQKLKTELEGLKKDIYDERKADQKLKTEIEGLHDDINYHIFVIKRQNGIIRELKKKQLAQEEVLKNRSVTINTEIKGLEKKQQEQEEVLKNRSVKIDTEIQGLESKQQAQDEVTKKRSVKIDTAIKELHNETSLGLGIECDPKKVIYAPRYTTENSMRQCYTFDGGNAYFYLHFVGYGLYGTYDESVDYDHISFIDCTEKCKVKQQQDRLWNALNYRLSDGSCFCLKRSRGFDPRYGNWFMYAFTP